MGADCARQGGREELQPIPECMEKSAVASLQKVTRLSACCISAQNLETGHGSRPHLELIIQQEMM